MEATTITRERAAGIEVRGPMRPLYDEILTAEALSFLARLTREFRPRIDEALARRRERQARLDAGETLEFMNLHPEDWTVAPIPADLMYPVVRDRLPRGELGAERQHEPGRPQ